MNTKLKLFIVFCTAFLVLVSFGQKGFTADDEKSKPVTSKITDVIVYSNQAVVTRAGSIKLDQGINRIVFDDLPESLSDSSVRIVLKGASDPKMVNMEVVKDFITKNKNEEAEKVQKRLMELYKERDKLSKDMNDVYQKINFLNSFNVGTVPSGDNKKPEPMPLAPETWEKTLDFLDKAFTTHNKTLKELADKLEDLNSDIAVAEAQQRYFMSYEVTSVKRVFLEVECRQAGQTELELSYVAYGPRWYPRYDLIADVEKGEVELVGYALVSQKTGEDWSNANVTFSAAQPTLSADLPELLAWHISTLPAQQLYQLVEGKKALEKLSKKKYESSRRKAYAPSSRMRQDSLNQSQYSQKAGRPSGKLQSNQDGFAYNGEKLNNARDQKNREVNEIFGNLENQKRALSRNDYRTYKELNKQLQQQIESDKKLNDAFKPLVKQSMSNIDLADRYIRSQKWLSNLIDPVSSSSGYDYRWSALRKETVLSDGVYNKVVIIKEKVKVDFRYEIAPSLSKFSFLATKLINRDRQPLLAGPASVFLTTDFVGDTNISTVAPSESVKLNLGTDDSIAVKTKTESKRETSGWTSSKHTYLNTVEIKIENNKKIPVNIHVIDKIPVMDPNEKKLKLKDIEITPEPTVHSKMGILKWDFKLNPSDKKDIKFKYIITHPSDSITYGRILSCYSEENAVQEVK